MTYQATTDAIAQGAGLPVELIEKIGKATVRLEEVSAEMVKAKEEDSARWTELNTERQAQAALLTQLQTAHQKAVMDADTQAAVEAAAEWRAFRDGLRAPSKAAAIAGGQAPSKASYTPGDFLYNVWAGNHRDYEVQIAAKASLKSISDHEAAWGNPMKATVGSTDATGGWIIPNAIVDELIKPGVYSNIYRELMTVVPGVTTAAVDLPFRLSARSRALVIGFGTTKTNLDLAYNGYAATMYTLAQIYDIGNQFLRQSRGAAEQDVMQELAAGFSAGESYYVREGSGSSEPYGYTSAITNGPAAFRSTFTPSATTLAGSMATSVATATGALAGRGVTPTAGVMSATSYWTMVSQGTDTAGFFFAPAGGPDAIRPGTLMSPFGIPIYPDPGADAVGTAAVIDNLIVADWKKFKLFFGQSYRVDSSDQAGTRWDSNLTGFRGEEEMGFDARPAVYAGHAQAITDIVP